MTSAVASWLLVDALRVSSSASSGAFRALELAVTSCFDWKLKLIGLGLVSGVFLRTSENVFSLSFGNTEESDCGF